MSSEDLLGAPMTDGNDGVISGPRTPEQIVAHKHLQQVQAQVDEVVDIMRTNVDKVIEKDEKLSKLQYTAENLEENASHFKQQAGKLKRKFFLQNMKMIVIVGVIGLAILLVIIVKLLPEKRSMSDELEDIAVTIQVPTDITFPEDYDESSTRSTNLDVSTKI